MVYNGLNYAEGIANTMMLIIFNNDSYHFFHKIYYDKNENYFLGEVN